MSTETAPLTTTYTARPIPAGALAELRTSDDAGRPCAPYTAPEGGEPLRCCLRRAERDERIALVSYAPLRRWAAETGAEPEAYDEQGPVFVHAAPCEGPRPSGTYPFAHAGALRTLRRYDTAGRITGGRLLHLPDDTTKPLDEALTEAFENPETTLVHVRAVEHGCFLFEIRRP
ncbi:DUF1203 domain-containing protein [Streptomyces sp. NPDC091278]|uniref:DUF1203 domain-containing protein n=1 Tax=Streptomyces sp. NPDC091278 TaxID=3155301 RepID=UPI00344D0C3C